MIYKVTAETPVPEHVLADPRVRKCTGPCGRMTRNYDMKISDFPGTVCRSFAGSCQKCHNDVVRDSPEGKKREDEKLARTMDSLNAWNAQRARRLSKARSMADAR